VICLGNPFHVGCGKIDLFVTGMILPGYFHGQVKIGDRLGLHTLGSVDQKETPPRCPVAEAWENFIRKMDMAGRICGSNLRDILFLSIPGVIRKRNGLALAG